MSGRTQLNRSVRVAVNGVARCASDQELLTAFVQSADSVAFEAIVQRHGPLVYSVSRAVLQDPADAADACQAAFLLLHRKARTIRHAGTLSSWLFRVARRAALEIQRSSRRRRQVERAASKSEQVQSPEMSWREACAILHEELDRLPARYRLPLLACYLEGKTRDETAEQFGWTADSLRGRIDRGRAMLCKRLEKRGVTLSAGLLAAVVPTAVPAGIVAAVLAPSPLVSTVAQTISRAGHAVAFGSMSMAAAIFVGVATLMSGAGDSKPSPKTPVLAKEVAVEEGMPSAKVDVFGDPLPPGAIARLGTVRFNHGEGLNHLEYSHDGKSLRSFGGRRIVHWEIATGKVLREWNVPQDRVGPMAVVDDNKPTVLVLPDHSGDVVRWWDGEKNSEVTSARVAGMGSGYKRLSPNGRYCVAQTATQLRFYETKAFKLLHTVPITGPQRVGDQFSYPHSTTFVGNSRFVIADGTGRLELWNIEDGKRIREFHQDAPAAIMVGSGDGKTLAVLEHHVGAIDKYLDKDLVHVWDLETGKKKHSLAAKPKSWFMDVRLSEDGRTLAAIAFRPSGTELLVWDTVSGKLVHEIPNVLATKLGLRADGLQIACGRTWGSTPIIDIGPDAKISQPGDDYSHATSIAFGPSNRILVTGNASVSTWDAVSGRRLSEVDFARFNSMDPLRTHSPDGRYAATYQGERQKCDLIIRDTLSGKEVLKIAGCGSQAAFSADSTLVTSQHWDPGLKRRYYEVRNLKSGAVVSRVESKRSDWASSFHLVGVENTLIVNGKEVVGYSILDGRELFAWRIPRAQIDTKGRSVQGPGEIERSTWRIFAASPDGTLSAGLREFENFGHPWPLSERLYICDTRTGKILQRCSDSGRQTGNRGAIRFSPDSRLLATSDGTAVLLWETSTGKHIRKWDGHRAEIADLAFSADGRRLASASYDSTVLVWDVSSSTKSEPGEWWNQLASEDATIAFSAILQLADDPNIAVLRKNLRPATDADQAKMKRLVEELNDDQFRVRDRAFKELGDLGHFAKPILQSAAAKPASTEHLARIEQLLSKTVGPPASGDALRIWRALSALEANAGDEAKGLIRELARGSSNAWVTVEAIAAQKRIEKR